MSAPTRQLGKLSIGGNMPATTRAQARRAGEDVPYHHDQSSSSDSDGDEQTSSGDESVSPSPSALVYGRSTISYDLRQLSQAARARAISGLTAEYAVDKCRSTRSGFEFHVSDYGRIHLGQGPLTCSCREYGRAKEACRHIFWLVDQLHRWVLPGRPSPGVPLLSSGESPRFSPMFEMIGDNMEEIARKVNWPYSAGAGSPVDSTSEYTSTMSRPDKARDIMSAFSETILPEEFRPDLVETINQPRTPEECVVQGDFEATMFRLAVHDENVYLGLRRAMPAGARAVIFFDKVNRRCHNLLADFDRYRQNGVRRRDGKALEIPVVVTELHAILALVQKNIYLRSPHGTKGAAEALVALLRNIAQRNYDAFENSTWGRRPVPGETAEDRNLFAQLICDVDDDDEFFVLNCLETLPDEVIKQYAKHLDSIFDTLQENGAPVPYMRKLQILIAGNDRAGGSGVAMGSSGHKRPATGSKTSGSKRIK
ncbi:hypothetical protein VTO42DRAFT_6324 [Malbranchea cinnamomea]